MTTRTRAKTNSEPNMDSDSDSDHAQASLDRQQANKTKTKTKSPWSRDNDLNLSYSPFFLPEFFHADADAGNGEESDEKCLDFGVCFSGGGARSCSIMEGVIRGLHERKLLSKVQLMSLVSGGAFAYCGFLSFLFNQRAKSQGVEPSELKPFTPSYEEVSEALDGLDRHLDANLAGFHFLGRKFAISTFIGLLTNIVVSLAIAWLVSQAVNDGVGPCLRKAVEFELNDSNRTSWMRPDPDGFAFGCVFKLWLSRASSFLNIDWMKMNMGLSMSTSTGENIDININIRSKLYGLVAPVLSVLPTSTPQFSTSTWVIILVAGIIIEHLTDELMLSLDPFPLRDKGRFTQAFFSVIASCKTVLSVILKLFIGISIIVILWDVFFSAIYFTHNVLFPMFGTVRMSTAKIINTYFLYVMASENQNPNQDQTESLTTDVLSLLAVVLLVLLFIVVIYKVFKPSFASFLLDKLAFFSWLVLIVFACSLRVFDMGEGEGEGSRSGYVHGFSSTFNYVIVSASISIMAYYGISAANKHRHYTQIVKESFLCPEIASKLTLNDLTKLKSTSIVLNATVHNVCVRNVGDSPEHIFVRPQFGDGEGEKEIGVSTLHSGQIQGEGVDVGVGEGESGSVGDGEISLDYSAVSRSKRRKSDTATAIDTDTTTDTQRQRLRLLNRVKSASTTTTTRSRNPNPNSNSNSTSTRKTKNPLYSSSYYLYDPITSLDRHSVGVGSQMRRLNMNLNLNDSHTCVQADGRGTCMFPCDEGWELGARSVFMMSGSISGAPGIGFRKTNEYIGHWSLGEVMSASASFWTGVVELSGAVRSIGGRFSLFLYNWTLGTWVYSPKLLPSPKEPLFVLLRLPYLRRWIYGEGGEGVSEGEGKGKGKRKGKGRNGIKLLNDDSHSTPSPSLSPSHSLNRVVQLHANLYSALLFIVPVLVISIFWNSSLLAVCILSVVIVEHFGGLWIPLLKRILHFQSWFANHYMVLGVSTTDCPSHYLTDGAHLDNLGLLTMLLSRTKNIIVFDATFDDIIIFDDLHKSMQVCERRLGVKFTICEEGDGEGEGEGEGGRGGEQSRPIHGIDALRHTLHTKNDSNRDGDSDFVEKRVLKLRVDYPSVLNSKEKLEKEKEKPVFSYVWYVKTTLKTRTLPVSLRLYGLNNTQFPNHPTVDLYDSLRFRAYRDLGRHCVDDLMQDRLLRNEWRV